MKNEEKVEQVEEKAKEYLKEGREKGKEFLRKGQEAVGDIEGKITDNPWPYLAGTAAFAFLLGFFMRGSRRD